MGVADYSKRQLKTIRFPFQEHRSKPHPSIMSSRELLISSPRCTCTDASDYVRSLLCATLLVGSVAMQCWSLTSFITQASSRPAFLNLFLPQHPFWSRLSSPAPHAIGQHLVTIRIK